MSKIISQLSCTLFLAILITGETSLNNQKNCVIENPPKKVLTFKNPIWEEKTSDPYVHFHHDHHYYWTFTDGLNIVLKRSKQLTELNSSKSETVFDNQESTFIHNGQLGRGVNLIAPKIHHIGKKWFIYFAMEIHNGSHIVQEHRNYVIEALTKDPFGSYGPPHKLSPEDSDTYSTHGTVLQYPNGFLYFIWSGKSHSDSDTTDIYMSMMDSPLKLSGYRLLLRRPSMDWEMMSGAGAVLEAPQIFSNFGRIFLVFSASNSSDPDNCLGLSSIEEWKNPFVAGNWFHNLHACVFGRNDDEAVYGVGKVSITTSPALAEVVSNFQTPTLACLDRKESWIIYTGSDEPRGESSIRAERFGWTMDGYPDFPAPAGIKLQHVVPSACIYSEEYRHLC